jgi:hypothetical protein
LFIHNLLLGFHFDTVQVQFGHYSELTLEAEQSAFAVVIVQAEEVLGEPGMDGKVAITVELKARHAQI